MERGGGLALRSSTVMEKSMRPPREREREREGERERERERERESARLALLHGDGEEYAAAVDRRLLVHPERRPAAGSRDGGAEDRDGAGGCARLALEPADGAVARDAAGDGAGDAAVEQAAGEGLLGQLVHVEPAGAADGVLVGHDVLPGEKQGGHEGTAGAAVVEHVEADGLAEEGLVEGQLELLVPDGVDGEAAGVGLDLARGAGDADEGVGAPHGVDGAEVLRLVDAEDEVVAAGGGDEGVDARDDHELGGDALQLGDVALHRAGLVDAVDDDVHANEAGRQGRLLGEQVDEGEPLHRQFVVRHMEHIQHSDLEQPDQFGAKQSAVMQDFYRQEACEKCCWLAAECKLENVVEKWSRGFLMYFANICVIVRVA